MKINIDEIKPQIKILESPKMKAIISLDFGDFLVKGFRILLSEQYKNYKGDNLWLVPPAYQGVGRKYHPIFFCPDKELWKTLEKKIYEEYYRQVDIYYKKRFDLKEINIDEVFPE